MTRSSFGPRLLVLAALLPILSSCTTLAPAIFSRPDIAGGVNFAEITRFTRFYRDMRYESKTVIARTVAPSYDEFNIVDLPRTRNRYMIGTSFSKKRQDIWIRGTANLRNAGFDVDYALHDNETLGVPLHKGFEEITLALYASIRPRLRDDYDLVIFGHSMGAAEAEILAMLLWKDGYHVAQVYASGAPRVTTLSGKRAYAFLPILRIVDPGDPVPFLPPRDIVSSRDPYTHLGLALLLLDGPFYCLLGSEDANDEVSDALWPLVTRESFSRQVALHLTPGYLDRLEPKLTLAIQVPFAERATHLPLPPSPRDSQSSIDRNRFGR